jgi:hypothetical protein
MRTPRAILDVFIAAHALLMSKAMRFRFSNLPIALMAIIAVASMVKGAGSRDAIQLAEDIGTLGGALGTGADWDASYVSLDVLSRNAAPSMEIFGDVTARATLPADGLERVRADRLNDITVPDKRMPPDSVCVLRFEHNGKSYEVMGQLPEHLERGQHVVTGPMNPVTLCRPLSRHGGRKG